MTAGIYAKRRTPNCIATARHIHTLVKLITRKDRSGPYKRALQGINRAEWHKSIMRNQANITHLVVSAGGKRKTETVARNEKM